MIEKELVTGRLTRRPMKTAIEKGGGGVSPESVKQFPGGAPESYDWNTKFMEVNKLLEPWLRGTLADVPAVPRAALHALELAKEDLERWCGTLSDAQMNARPAGIAPIAFHMRHIARSVDRLLTYAEGNRLSEAQIAAMKSELDPGAKREELFFELETALRKSAARIRALDVSRLDESRVVGKKQLPTTLGGLLVHIADHTQRHVGQAVTTSKIVLAQPS